MTVGRHSSGSEGLRRPLTGGPARVWRAPVHGPVGRPVRGADGLPTPEALPL